MNSWTRTRRPNRVHEYGTSKAAAHVAVSTSIGLEEAMVKLAFEQGVSKSTIWELAALVLLAERGKCVTAPAAGAIGAAPLAVQFFQKILDGEAW